jgi:acetoin utilization deacetylase AcuC-like enzyme/ankyrin repeat protein
MSEEVFSLIKAGSSFDELESYLTSLPIDHENLHLILNRRNVDRYTPFHCAIFARNMDACRVLLKYGADINLKCHGSPCLHLALSTAMLPNGGYNFGIDLFNLLLDNNVDCTAKDDQLAGILHLAAEYNLSNILTKLLNNDTIDIEIDGKDRGGLRPIHRAAQRDAADAARVLTTNGCSIDAQTSYGTTPLHTCASNAASKTWGVLIEAGAKLDKIDSWGRSPVQLANICGYNAVDDVDGTGCSGLEPNTDMLSEQNMLDSPTSVITHPYCRKHYTCPPSEEGQEVPPENMKRLHVIIDENDGALKSKDIASKLVWNEDCKPAAMSDVLRVHEWSYIRKIQGHCEQIRPDPESYGGIGNLDGDTTLSRLTFEAALRGAGAVCEGVDEIMQGRARNIFAPVRPPGHHAGPRGLTKGEEGGPDSHGFCFLNNISIGAAYAMNKYRETIKKIAIVDFDVHHGNGTEETVRWLKPGLDQEEFFGNSNFGSINVPRYKPWFGEDDSSNVLFVSIHGYGPRERGLESMFPQGAFYPGSGRTTLPDHDQLKKRASAGSDGTENSAPTTTYETVDVNAMKEGESNEEGEDKQQTISDMMSNDEDEDEDDGDYDEFEGMGMAVEDADDDSEAFTSEGQYTSRKLRAMRKLYTDMDAYSTSKKDRDALILDVGVSLPASPDMTSGEYRHQWRNYFRQEIFSRLMEFSPDMIFISAGFDAHKKDGINSGYIALVEEDFDWVTQGLIRVANSCCEGRVVSALEGGYQIGGEFSSAFAKSVKTHVAALTTGAKTVAPWSNDDAEIERKVEKALLDEAAERRLQKIIQQQKREEEERIAHIARLAAEAEAAAEAQSLEGYVEDSLEGIAVKSETVTASEDDDGNARKRRRQPVDYQALDKELQAQKGSASLASLDA